MCNDVLIIYRPLDGVPRFVQMRSNANLFGFGWSAGPAGRSQQPATSKEGKTKKANSFTIDIRALQ